MTALAKDRNTAFRVAGRHLEMEVKAAAVIYKGAMVAVDATGYLIPASDTAALIVMGVALEAADNTSGSSGDLKVRVDRGGVAEFVASSLTIANVGGTVTVVDDQTVGKAADTTNDIIAGVLEKLTGTTAQVRMIDWA